MSTTARLTSDRSDHPRPTVSLTVVAPVSAALAQLEQVLDVFRTVNRRAKDLISDARLQQLEWVASELAIALPLGLSESAGESLADLLAPEAVTSYLQLSRGGSLRTMPTVDTNPASADASERIRIYCLEAFARQAKLPFENPEMPDWRSLLRPTVSPRFRDVITEHLEREAGRWSEVDRPDTLVRGLAMWGVMCDTLPRLGELESMRLADLKVDQDPGTLTLIRQPQGGLRGRMPAQETVRLSESTVHLLKDWLGRREYLLARLQGGVPTHLWLSTFPNPDAGVPIHRRGISRWYKKVADSVQKQQDADGVPESDLVPTRWETMRRTLLAEREARQANG